MSVNDIINRHKKHLTNAQVHSLVKLSNEYKQLNAGRRAEAYGDLYTNHQDFRRGLQNMGLASRRGNIISGREVMGQVRVDDAYHRFNDQLKNIEDRMLDNAAGNMRAQNIARQQVAQPRNFVDNLADQIKQRYAEKKEFNENAVDPRIGNMQKPTKVQPQKTVPQVQGDIDPRFAQPVSAPDKARMAQIIPQARTAQRTANVQDAVAQAFDNANKAANPAAYAALEVKYATKQKALADNTARWDREIADGDKIAKDDPEYKLYKNRAEKARREKANAQSSLYRTQLAMNLPADVGTLVAADDADFAVRYDAAQKAAEKAQKAYSEYKEGGARFRTDPEWIKAHTDVLKSGNIKTALEDDYKRTQTVLARFEQAKAYRNMTTPMDFYARDIPVDESLVPSVPKWVRPNEWDGSNFKTAFANGWEADDYAKEHDTKGSKYAALVNDWSLVNGRTALLYSQKFQVPQKLLNAKDFFTEVIGKGGTTRDSDHNRFLGECVMAYKGDYESSGTKSEKEQMDAMLTLANLMTDEERATFNAILNRSGASAADEYFKHLYNDVLPTRFNEYVHNEQKFDTRDALGKVEQSLVSIPVNLAQGVTGVAHTMTTQQDDPIAANLGARKYNTAQSMRDVVSEDMSEFGKFAYGTGMSMADSMTVAAISGGIGSIAEGLGVSAAVAGKIGSALGGSLLGGSAFNSAYSEALDRGLSPDKARATALGQGINEMLFEAVSLDLVVSQFQHGGVLKVAKNRWVNWAVNSLVSAGVEGSEEVFTDMANNLWDNQINGIFSEELTKLREYINDGMSYEEAKRKVALEYDAQLGMSFLGGALSGGIMGGGATFLGMIQQRDIANHGKSIRTDAKAMDELTNFDYKSEEAKEILSQKVKTDTDIGMLDIIRTQELVEQSEQYIDKAVEEGKMPQEVADIYKKFVENGVQTEDNMNGITDADADQMMPYVDVLKDAEAIRAGLGKIVEDQKAARAEFVKLSPTEQQQKLASIQSEATSVRNAQSLRVTSKESQASAQVATAAYQSKNVAKDITIKGNKVTTQRGSVTFDYDGKTSTESMTENQRRALRFCMAVANKTGVNIRVSQQFIGDQANKNGYYDPKTNTIHVNLSGTNSVVYTVSHELTHYLKEHNAQAYSDLSAEIQKQLAKDDLVGTDLPEMYQDIIGKYMTGDNTLFEALVEYEKDRYAKNDIALNQADAEEEVVARCCESFLGNEAFIQTMTQKHERSARAVSRFLNELRSDVASLQSEAAVRGMQGNYYSDVSPENDILAQMGDIDRVAKLWSKALNEIADKRAKAKKATGEIKASQMDKSSNANRRDYSMEEFNRLYKEGVRAVKVKDLSAFKNKKISSIDQTNVASFALKRVQSMNYKSDNAGYVFFESTGIKATVTEKSFRHGSTDKSVEYLIACMNISELAKSAIPVNELNLSENHKNPGTIYFAIAQTNRSAFLVRMVVENGTGEVDGLNVLYAIKKESPSTASASAQSQTVTRDDVIPAHLRKHDELMRTSSIFNIKDFLEIVNSFEIGKSSLSLNVLKNLNSTRHNEPRITPNLRYSISDREYIAKRDQYRKESESIKNELQDVRAKLQSVEESDNYKSAFAKLSEKSISDEEWKAAVDEFARVEVESGYDALYKRQKELIEKQSNLSKEWDKVTREKEQADYENAVKESGLSEAEYSRKQAVKEFGYTPYYYDAGYILPNGKMLNFSGEKGRHYGSRGQDHRAIGTIYPDSQGSDAMIRFMKDGNIRIMAETPGIDLSSSVEPTREQYATIRAFAEHSRREEYFNVDLSDERGNNVGTLEYDGNVNPTRIVNDIKHFYETGEVREPSSISQFHYSIMDKDFRMTKRGNVRTFEQNGTTANVIGSSVELEGGSLLNRVRMLQNLAEEYGSVTVTATSEKEAQAFEKAGAKRETDAFSNAEHGTWVFEHTESKYEKDSQYDAKQKRNFADAVLKEVGTRKNFTQDELRVFKAKLEKAFAVLHNATFGKGDQLAAYEYADKLFDSILNRYSEMSEADADMREAILAEMPRTYDGKGRIFHEIEVTEGQMAEIKHAFGSVAAYNQALSKALGTRVYVKQTENAKTLEDIFASDSRFDATTNEGDMPGALLNMAQETIAKRTNPLRAESQERTAAKEAMFEKALSIVGVEKTTAQKVREAVKDARAEERAKAKDNTAKAVSEARLAERMHEGAIRAQERRASAEREVNIKRTAANREAKLKEITKQKLEQQKTEQLRRDVKRVALKWNQRLVKMLANPTEASHIPIQLAQEVAEFTKALTEYIDRGTERGRLNLEKIKRAYEHSFADESIIAEAKAEDPHFDPRGLLPVEYDKEGKVIKDETLIHMIDALNEVTKDRTFKDLSANEMRMLLNTVRAVGYKVYEANRMIGTEERKAIWKVGSTMVNQLEATHVSKKMRGYLETSLDLRRIAKIFSGSDENAEFVKLVDQLNKGAIEKEHVAQVLQDMFKPVTDQYGDEIRKWYGNKAEWIDTGITKHGKKVEITKGMRVSLALHVLNEGNMRHIENGGLTIPEREMYRKGKLKDAYANGELVRLSKKQIYEIISHMTDAEKAYVAVAKEFFHKRTGYYVNKTSLQLLGYRKAIVENYFPIHTDQNYTKTDFASLKMDGSIEGQGFLKERVLASNPVYLEDITSVVNRQIRGVALYAGLAVPMRNFNAVMNAAVYEDDNGVWSPRTTVKQAMTKQMGDYGAKVVQGFLTDVSEMSHVDVSPMERFAGKLATNYVKAVLLGNLKVAMKQVASYPTAAAVIPWKYLAKALVAGGRNNRVISRANVDLINQYTPLYQMRRAGQANEIASIMQKRGMEDKLPWLLGWITKMDVMTVGRLWSAAEYMVADQQKNLVKGSDAYYKAVAQVFNDTVQQTQPNFTPLQRNAALRSKNPIVRSLVLFGTQRMQNGGILLEAAYELKQSKGKSKAEIQAAKVKLGRAVASQIIQNILLIVASLAVDALRGRMKAWQDNDKEITAESLAKGMGDMFLSNAVGSFLGGSEVYELVSAWYKKVTYGTTYDTEFTVPALEAAEFILNYLREELPDTVLYLKSKDHSLDEKLEKAKTSGAKLVRAAGYATGIPFENAYKDLFKGIIPAIEDHKDWLKTGEFPQWWLHQSGKLDKEKTAANYKEWTNEGKKGSTYLYWENALKDVSTTEEKAEKLFEDLTLTSEEKATLLRMFTGNSRYPTMSEGTVVYNSSGEVIADFSNLDAFRVSQLSDAKYAGYQKAVEMGVPSDYASTAFVKFTEYRKDGAGYNQKFREWMKMVGATPEQRAKLEVCVIGDDGTKKRYDVGQDLIKTGMNANDAYLLIENMRDTKKDDSEKYLSKVTEKQKKLIYEWKGWKYGK